MWGSSISLAALKARLPASTTLRSCSCLFWAELQIPTSRQPGGRPLSSLKCCPLLRGGLIQLNLEGSRDCLIWGKKGIFFPCPQTEFYLEGSAPVQVGPLHLPFLVHVQCGSSVSWHIDGILYLGWECLVFCLSLVAQSPFVSPWEIHSNQPYRSNKYTFLKSPFMSYLSLLTCQVSILEPQTVIKTKCLIWLRQCACLIKKKRLRQWA